MDWTYDDLTVFEVAAALERERPWFTEIPPGALSMIGLAAIRRLPPFCWLPLGGDCYPTGRATASNCMTAGYVSHCGSPRWLGFPVRAKEIHAPCIASVIRRRVGGSMPSIMGAWLHLSVLPKVKGSSRQCVAPKRPPYAGEARSNR